MKITLLACFLICTAVVMADETPQIELKHRSSFNEDTETRNPFWPIGWKPTAKTAPVNPEHAGPNIPSSAFVVTSITLDPGARFAIINGKTLAEGQQFGFQVGSQLYQITVKRIEDGRVILLRHDQEIIVPLRRK
jgi:hypothetical protein